MITDEVASLFERASNTAQDIIFSPDFLWQLLAIGLIYVCAFVFARLIRRQVPFMDAPPDAGAHALRVLGYKLGGTVFPILVITFLKLSATLGERYQLDPWLLKIAFIIAVLIFLNSFIRAFVGSQTVALLLRWVGLPIIFLHMIGVLPVVVSALESISIEVGNVDISAYGVVRVILFGALLFWLGRASNNLGQDMIRSHTALDITTKEVMAKLFEVALFCIAFLLLLNIMGINLTALAVFGGAVGVGLGLGLQSIASNFISGIIILLDRSLTVGDFVELEEGPKGFVREFKMRYAVVETYDGKDILVPNEKFISGLLINWTHKDPKQRYRIDFAVAYKTDIRAMCEIIKNAVAEHPQVISGEDVPFEERPDCEIDSFGDSGVNMFVEFWMEGIDDGKNRVGGDLLLTVFETLREHGIEIPFPQREVRVLNDRPLSFTNTTP
ncbi:mechanosensitive ion channel [Alteromonas ponticola]|uniref:Mechanosensitive ion channel n=1 Tax=Alteromonas aquimaris TaxID=2998417 RepID=A0ABT3P3Z1_9ALTE|nr:mechanosensitive ion channel domain-containing protein [Alteromonas aquimaris]MCW8107447.1 mechanosensitive ion channel [Alteromonas aquimaris]